MLKGRGNQRMTAVTFVGILAETWTVYLCTLEYNTVLWETDSDSIRVDNLIDQIVTKINTFVIIRLSRLLLWQIIDSRIIYSPVLLNWSCGSSVDTAKTWTTVVRLLEDRGSLLLFARISGRIRGLQSLFSESKRAGALGDCQLHVPQSCRISGGEPPRPLFLYANYCLELRSFDCKN